MSRATRDRRSSPRPLPAERLPPDEQTIIDRFFRPLAGEGAFGLRDDAARLRVPPDCDLVVTADMIAVGVHFLPGDPAGTIAQKALRVNVSDLAAKGARPIAYTLSIGCGDDLGEVWLADFAEGLRRDQALFGLTLLGGDTIIVPSGPVISVTAFGAAPSGRMVHRFSGQAGDALYVSGMIGAAAGGLAILKGEPGPWNALPAEDQESLVRRYRVPEPRVSLAPALVKFASAAMDVSDGLIGDCDKLCGASRCGATVEADRVPMPPGLAGADFSILARLLSAGDDYEILAAVRPDDESGFREAAEGAGVVVTRIGALTEGSGPTEVRVAGVALALNRRSWVHGQREPSGDR